MQVLQCKYEMRKNYTKKQHRNDKKQKIKNTGKFGKGNNTDIMLKCCLNVGIIKRNCERLGGIA